MKKAAGVFAIVLAGGEGKRLAPLTRRTAKPAIAFHQRHRLIDFALSNLHNSGIPAVHVLTQYQPQSVLQHLEATWKRSESGPDCLVKAFVGGAGRLPRFAGTADAVYRIRQAIIDQRPDVVAVFSADHVYRMDVRQMIDFHRQCDAAATVAALPVPCDMARSFGVIDVDGRGRITRFSEKPQQPSSMPARPGFALASMGNYLFEPNVLLRALAANHADGGNDFGSHLLPALLASSHRLMAYDFTVNVIEGLEEECEPHYWRDVGTLDAYFSAHLDTMAPAGMRPAFEVAARRWPIRGAAAVNCRDGSGWGLGRYPQPATASARAQVEQSILRPGARVGERAQVFRCLLGDDVEVGPRCRLRNVIVEAGTRLPEGFEAGFDLEQDRKRLPVSDGGIVVIPRDWVESRPANSPSRRLAWPHPNAGPALIASPSLHVAPSMKGSSRGNSQGVAALASGDGFHEGRRISGRIGFTATAEEAGHAAPG